MDAAQRDVGLDWAGALELIRRTRAELPDALVANGCGTDHLNPADARDLDDVIRAYLEQVEAIQALDARIILMASRALARVAKRPPITSRSMTACWPPATIRSCCTGWATCSTRSWPLLGRGPVRGRAGHRA